MKLREHFLEDHGCLRRACLATSRALVWPPLRVCTGECGPRRLFLRLHICMCACRPLFSLSGCFGHGDTRHILQCTSGKQYCHFLAVLEAPLVVRVQVWQSVLGHKYLLCLCSALYARGFAEVSPRCCSRCFASAVCCDVVFAFSVWVAWVCHFLRKASQARPVSAHVGFFRHACRLLASWR